MKFIELKKDLQSSRHSIYLIEGDDAYFRSSAEKQIRSAFLQMEELNFASFDGAECKGSAAQNLLTAAEAVPFMSEYRIIKVTDFYPTEAEYEKYLKSAFENFPQTTILLIVNSQGKKGADLKRKHCITYIDCNRCDRETVAKWAYLTMKRAGVASSVESCEAVADYCQNDMARVSREVEKLIEWATESKKITKADVDLLVYKDADFRIYQMTNAAARKDFTTFTEILKDLLSKGFDENSQITSLINYFKNLLTVLTNPAEKEVLEKLKMSDYVLGKTRQQAKAMGEERLIGLIHGLYAVSSKLKSGAYSADGALECAVCKVFFGE